jgi:hypothetical protein
VAFDNITMGSATPGGSGTVPVPALSEWGLILLGILLLGAAARVFRSASARI